MNLSQKELDDIEARASQATEGPWDWRKGHGSGAYVVASGGPPFFRYICEGLKVPGQPPFDDEFWEGDDNAAFIAHARTDVPRLVEEVKRLREVLGFLEAEMNSALGHEEVSGEWLEALYARVAEALK